MIFAKRVALVFSAVVFLLFLRSRTPSYHSTLQGLSQSVGLGELVADEEESAPLRHQTTQQKPEKSSSAEPLTNDALLVPFGSTEQVQDASTKYTRGVVIGRLQSENVTWLDEYLVPSNNDYFQPYIYLVNDHSAPLHTPVNKGHEVMPYLTYIIDHYDSLPDVTLFLHPHRTAWHTPELLNHDASEILKRLSTEKVLREGYVNLRCHWDPGCPDRLYPGRSYTDFKKPEEIAIANAWAEMFPDDPIPDALGAPCCAQFAVAKHRIRSIPKAHFERYRNWLLRTAEEDRISGRVFEYLWQKIFTNQAILCPDARACYCDTYGICFTTPETFETWFDNHHWWLERMKELEKWEEKAHEIDKIRNWNKIEQMKLEIPLPGRNVELKREIAERFEVLTVLRTQALQNGTDPEVRARVAGRPWKEGNGY